MASTMLCTLCSLGGHLALVVRSTPSLIPLLSGNMRSFRTTTPYAEETQIPFSRYEELDNKWRKNMKYLDNKWRKANQLLSEQLRQESVNVQRIKNDALKVMDEKLRLEHNFNVSGALERIAFQACLERKIIDQGGVQKNLDALAAHQDFGKILKNEVANNMLVANDVERCVKC
ncbi:hypothetical protein BDD12DRAFT_979868, partial [Trichophaea hybrida]